MLIPFTAASDVLDSSWTLAWPAQGLAPCATVRPVRVHCAVPCTPGGPLNPTLVLHGPRNHWRGRSCLVPVLPRIPKAEVGPYSRALAHLPWGGTLPLQSPPRLLEAVSSVSSVNPVMVAPPSSDVISPRMPSQNSSAFQNQLLTFDLTPYFISLDSQSFFRIWSLRKSCSLGSVTKNRLGPQTLRGFQCPGKCHPVLCIMQTHMCIYWQLSYPCHCLFSLFSLC